jgi:predicted Zn-dependent protease
MTGEDLSELLARRAPGEWELYGKRGTSRETVSRAAGATRAHRDEEGWAARWWEQGALRFAAASSPTGLRAAIEEAAALTAGAQDSLDWPTGAFGAEASEPAPLPEPPELFTELARQLAAESRGEAGLQELTIRVGRTTETIVNGRSLRAALSGSRLDGVATAVGRRGTRACEARVAFRWDEAPDTAALARRLADRTTLPLSEKPSPFERGELLLDPSVSSALLAALAGLFTAAVPRWVSRAQFASPAITIVDDATADTPCDGEGTKTRRVELVREGVLRGSLCDLSSAHRRRTPPTGHGVRPSYRTPPATRPRRLFFETASAVPPRELLEQVRRGLYASALVAPPRVELDADRYEIEFCGIAVVAGRAQGPVAGARCRGRISELLRRMTRLGSDRAFFPLPDLVGAPTILVERTSFE